MKLHAVSISQRVELLLSQESEAPMHLMTSEPLSVELYSMRIIAKTDNAAGVAGLAVGFRHLSAFREALRLLALSFGKIGDRGVPELRLSKIPLELFTRYSGEVPGCRKLRIAWDKYVEASNAYFLAFLESHAEEVKVRRGVALEHARRGLALALNVDANRPY